MPGKGKNKPNKKGLFSLKTDKPKKEGSVLERRTKEERQQDRYTSLKAKGKYNKAEDYKEKKNLAPDGSRGRIAVKPYNKKGPIAKKMDSSAAANQLKNLGKTSSKIEKKGAIYKKGSVLSKHFKSN